MAVSELRIGLTRTRSLMWVSGTVEARAWVMEVYVCSKVWDWLRLSPGILVRGPVLFASLLRLALAGMRSHDFSEISVFLFFYMPTAEHRTTASILLNIGCTLACCIDLTRERRTGLAYVTLSMSLLLSAPKTLSAILVTALFCTN